MPKSRQVAKVWKVKGIGKGNRRKLQKKWAQKIEELLEKEEITIKDTKELVKERAKWNKE